jgi:5-methylthioribose kinase
MALMPGSLLTQQTVLPYLHRRGLLHNGEEVAVTPLGGGVSNVVLRLRSPRFDWVLKQALPRLRVKDLWEADVTRAHREVLCGELLNRLIRPRPCPATVFEDRPANVFIIEHAPPEAEVWKSRLLRGDIDPSVAARVGRLLGLIHGRTSRNAEARRVFRSQKAFHQLRVDAYLLTTARRHPELAREIRAVAAAMGRIRVCLTHGDYSPKNILVKDCRCGKHPRIILLDHEVAHIGDPAFDLGFCLNHLFLKSFRRPQWRDRYMAAARAFWRAYCRAAPKRLHPDPGHLVRMLGCLMLARVDGKSPAEYITQPELKEAVRGFAAPLIRGEVGNIGSVIGARQEAGKSQIQTPKSKQKSQLPNPNRA